MTNEYFRAAHEHQLSYHTLKSLARNALTYSFLTTSEKDLELTRFNQLSAQFEASIAQLPGERGGSFFWDARRYAREAAGPPSRIVRLRAASRQSASWKGRARAFTSRGGPGRPAIVTGFAKPAGPSSSASEIAVTEHV
jgi:hypothetical protein